VLDLANNSIYVDANTGFQTDMSNEYTLVNWFSPGTKGLDIEPVERFYQPTNRDLNQTFLPCINTPSLTTDMSATTVNQSYDSNGLCGVSFYMPPNQYVRLNSFEIKFAYTQPSTDENNAMLGRTKPPPMSAGSTTNMFYQNRTTFVSVDSSASNDWDDAYILNRRNTKLCIFQTQDVIGKHISSILYSDAICSLTLQKITQVNNYKNGLGSVKTREPEWGTYYNYTFDTTRNQCVWDVPIPPGNQWRSTCMFADISSSIELGDVVYSNYFVTPPLENYTFLPRSFGVAPSIQFSTIQSSNDFKNSYTAIPFYNDPSDSVWKVGQMFGVSFTNTPCLPSPDILGENPYYGPLGGYAFSSDPIVSIRESKFHYWNGKLTFHNLELEYTPAFDLRAFGGFSNIQNEYQDTVLFAYDDPAKAIKDVSSSNATTEYWNWGQESSSKYIAFDDQSGYNYLSYIHDLPLQIGIPYVAQVRAYDPIPQMRTGLRIIGKNATDFGSVSFAQLANEIDALYNPPQGVSYVPISDTDANTFLQNLYSSPPNSSEYLQLVSTNNYARKSVYNFSHEYADALIQFDQSFQTTKTFGKNLGYKGTTYTFTGYEDALQQFSTLYNTVQAPYQNTVNILSTATGLLKEYAQDRYGTVLPNFAIKRNRITDPIPFQFLFSTMLNPPYTTMSDEWGLGYNLGFNKADTYPPRTTVVANTFIRIVQDYIYLKLNPELNMNKLAISNKEDLAETHDPSAEDSKYFSKILLNDFASYCRSAVQLPKHFAPVLGKLDTISFQLLDKTGTQIDNADCEFDLVLEVTEIQYGQKDNSSLIRPRLGT
jgi:hypothetical protein